MTELLTSAQMRAVERMAMDSGQASGAALMERAGAGVVAAIAAHWPGLAAGRALVLCGPGNNGGDGYVVARLLAGQGWAVTVLALGDPARLPPDAAANRARWAAMAGAMAPLDEASFAAAADPAPDLVVDALFGIGLTRPFDSLPGVCMTLNHWRGSGTTRVVAVDLPSGLCADSGRWLGEGNPMDEAILADLTVTFHAPKCGHYLGAGPMLCGALHVADLGLGEGPAGGVPLVAVRVAALDKAQLSHKFSHGAALVLAGGPGRGGAARLAARAALRVGAGLVTLVSPAAALAEHAARLDAVMLRDLAGLPALLADDRLRAVCAGPGLGLDCAGLLALLCASGRALVLDADALTVLAGDPGLRAALPADAVLTPHFGEFARLCPDLAARLTAPARQGPAWSRLQAAQEAAARLGAVVLLKGPDTVIAAPDGRLALHGAAYGRAAPWLATAGAGDVLAGLITGLRARGLAPFDAACTAAWLHVEAARAFGPGLIAEDLPDMLPAVLRGAAPAP